MIDPTYAVYGCVGDGIMGCTFADILKVGSKSTNGDGKWGQADLLGSILEWNLDWYGEYQIPCSNCADTHSNSGRVARGGGWRYDGPESSGRGYFVPEFRDSTWGARCARTP